MKQPTNNTTSLSVDINRAELALELRTYRLRQGLTQEALGERWGTSRYTIIRAEGAKPISWQQAYRIYNNLARDLRNEQ